MARGENDADGRKFGRRSNQLKHQSRGEGPRRNSGNFTRGSQLVTYEWQMLFACLTHPGGAAAGIGSSHVPALARPSRAVARTAAPAPRGAPQTDAIPGLSAPSPASRHEGRGGAGSRRCRGPATGIKGEGRAR